MFGFESFGVLFVDGGHAVKGAYEADAGIVRSGSQDGEIVVVVGQADPGSEAAEGGETGWEAFTALDSRYFADPCPKG
ncbi:MAG: hypothetical protein PHD87_09135 [Candidatus Cloacimonetes bacterium]|nr:hypothetical protein [Candidatus Cloacimonadota bacterium]